MGKEPNNRPKQCHQGLKALIPKDPFRGPEAAKAPTLVARRVRDEDQ
jgi:hypothetical protein